VGRSSTVAATEATARTTVRGLGAFGRGFGITVYLGPGYVVHLSSEHGLEWTQAEHRTWRLGFVAAVRR
jgi:hypothetical protein